MEDNSITNSIVTFATNLRYEDLPQDVILISRRCILDGLGVALAGTEHPGIDVIRRYLQPFAQIQESRVIGDVDFLLPTAFAALWNGFAGHVMDWDDTQLPEGPGRVYGLLLHPTMPPLAAGLAVCELISRILSEKVDGKTFLTAFVAGVEAESKMAVAINPDHYIKGFHTSGTVGTFGATITSAKLLNLDHKKMARALGLAASMAAGIRAGFGTMTKPFHVGRAASNGVTAAILAREGLTASENALDGQWGYLNVAGRGSDPELLVGRLGNPYSIVSPGVSIKPYPCGVLTHPTMDAMLSLMEEYHLEPDDIRRVTINAGSNILNPIRYEIANDELEAKFCFPFLLSAIILRGKGGKKEFSNTFVQSEICQNMQRRVRTVYDQEIEDMGWDRIRSKLVVETKDNQQLIRWADENYRGGPQNPLGDSELEKKFSDCAAGLLSESESRQVMDLIWTLERQDDVSLILDGLDWM